MKQQTRADLELILAHLVGKSIAPAELQPAIERTAVDPEAQTLFERLVSLLSWQDDPDWLEAIAAAGEGLTLPEVADFLADREALVELAPNLVAHFETLLAATPGDQAVELPAFPTFAEQFKTGQKSSPPQEETPDWIPGDGFEWRQVKESGRVIIRLAEAALKTAISNLQQGLQPPPDRLALAGPRRGQQSLFEMALMEGIADFEAIITLDTNWRDPAHCAVTVDVNIPSRGGWPNLADTEVALKKGETTVDTRLTNVFGRVVFERIATDELMKLNFEIKPRTNGG